MNAVLGTARIASGLAWSSLGTAINLLAQFVFLAVLARLLDPAAFGLVAMATLVVRLAGVVGQVGIAQALIQKASLTARDCSTAFALAAAFGTLLCAIVAAGAHAAAWVFDTPALAPLLGVFGLTLPMSALGALPLALLRRQGRFAPAAGLEVFGFCLGYGAVGVACAAAGLGAWSLIAATLAQQGLTLLAGLVVVRFPVAAGWSRDSASALFGYGARLSVVGLLEFLSANVEPTAIARALGTTGAGLWNRASTLANLPVEQAIGALVKVLFPALAAMQGDARRLGDGFLVLLLACGIVSVSFAAALAAAPHDIVGLLLGSRWQETVPVVAVLAWSVPLSFCYLACGLTLDSVAALGAKARLQTAVLAVRIALVLTALPFGLVAIATAAVAAEGLRLAFGAYAVSRTLALPFAAPLRVLAAIAAWGAWVHVAVALAAGLAPAWPLAARVALEAIAALGASAFAAAALLVAVPRYGPLCRFPTLDRWRRQLLARTPLRECAP